MVKLHFREQKILVLSVLVLLLLLFTVSSFTGFVVKGDIFTTIKNVFTPQTGNITVTTNPTQSRFYVDGQLKGSTPITVSGLSAGSHSIMISQTGYNDYTGSATVVSGQTIIVSRTLTRTSTAQSQTSTNTNTQTSTQSQTATSQQTTNTNSQTTRTQTNTGSQAANAQTPERRETPAERNVRIQDPRGAKAARWRAIIPEIKEFGSVVAAQNHFGFSGYHAEVSVANLGSPVKICWAYIYGANRNVDYNGCTDIAIETYRTTEAPSQIDYSCSTATNNNDDVPCYGYLIVYSEDNTQPILPGGVLCDDRDSTENYQTNVCMTLNFVRETDLFE